MLKSIYSVGYDAVADIRLSSVVASQTCEMRESPKIRTYSL